MTPKLECFKTRNGGQGGEIYLYLSFLFHASLGIQRGHGSECPLPWTQIEPSHIEMIEYHCLKCWLLWIRARWFSQCLTDTKPGASVTETNILSFMGGYDVISHTPHEHHHSDRIFGQRPKCDFSSFLSFFLDRGFHMDEIWRLLPSYTLEERLKNHCKQGLIQIETYSFAES